MTNPPQPARKLSRSQNSKSESVPSEALEPGIQKLFRVSLSPLTFGLSALFAALAVGDAFLAPESANLELSLSALGLSLFFLLARFFLGRKVIPDQYANLAGAAIAVAALGYCFERIFLLNLPFDSSALIIFMLTVGYVFLSTRLLLVLQATAFAGWLLTAIALDASTSDLWVPALKLAFASVISMLIHVVHLRSARRTEKYRTLSKKRKIELESARTTLEKTLETTEALKKESQNAIREMRQVQERFKRLTEATFEGIVIHEQGRIIDVNSAVVEMTDYDPAELLKSNLLSLIEADARGLFQENLRRENGALFESVILRKDGETVPVEICSRPLPYMGRTIQVAAIRDLRQRMNAEKALRLSEAKNRALLDAIPDLMFRIDAGGVILDYNPGKHGLILKDLPSLINRNVYEIFPKDLARQILSKIRRTLRRNKMQGLEFRHSTHGEIREYEGRFFVSGENETLVIVRDVTDSKSSTKRALENEHLYRQMFEENLAVKLLIDPESGEIVEANSAACRFYGYSLEALKSKKIMEINTLPSRKVKEEIHRAMAGESNFFTFNHKLANGENRNVEVFAGPINVDGRKLIYSIVHDVTDRHNAEKKLRESEERYRRFFEEDLTGDFISTPEGKLLDCNPAFLKIFGFSTREEAMACDLSALYPDASVRKSLINEILEKRNLEGKEVEFVSPAGRPIHVIENVSGVFDSDDKLVELRGYIFDVTERKTLEAQLLHSRKMEAVGRLAGGVAHDFNNLLTAITGYSQLMLDNLANPEALRNEIDEIKKACDLGSSLTTQLLTFSRRQIIQPETLDLNAVVADMEKLLKRLVGETIRLTVKKHDRPCKLKADLNQIKQVIMNLALNSLDATPDGGELNVETFVRKLDGAEKIAGEFVEKGAYVVLQVIDTGQGMDTNVKSHIFEPFFTTKDKGTGLGLSTVYGIVKQNNGFIEVKSAPKAGTQITIFFPEARSPQKAAISSEANSVPLVPGCGTILLVEDEDAVRQVTRLILSRNGYSVISASNGAHALEKSRRHSGKIDLMVSDMVMPGMNGRELAERMKAVRPELKIMFMSGYVADELLQSESGVREYSFLQKPFSPETLLSKIQQTMQTDSVKLPA